MKKRASRSVSIDKNLTLLSGFRVKLFDRDTSILVLSPIPNDEDNEDPAYRWASLDRISALRNRRRFGSIQHRAGQTAESRRAKA